MVTVHVTPVLHRPTPVGRLTALVVTERARHGGIGRALVAAAERLLAARGCALVEVTSNRRLTDAHAFYGRLGYDTTSLRFKKDLAPGR
jgi:GNAT superfamily N-acetyltransferase